MIASVRIRGFRSAHDVHLDPGPLSALIGQPGSGKSNLLVAIWKLLSADAPPLEPGDATVGSNGLVRVEATLARGSVLTLRSQNGSQRRTGKNAPRALFLPAALRGGPLLAGGATEAAVTSALGRHPSPALALIDTIASWLEQKVTGLVLMIEEPELFLRPHAQRSLYRLLREFAARGNQVLYSTHAATFLNVSRLEEIALLWRDREGATHLRRPQPLPENDSFRALNEFDAERSELLLGRAAILVEGMTEKLVFPFLFRALGYDADEEAISIVECGGKPNIPVIAQVCNLTEIPYLVVHDRDAPPGKRPIASERFVNAAIARVAGRARTIQLAPDFEAVARLHGHRHKPRRAVNWIAVPEGASVPQQLADVVHRSVALARNL